MADTHHTKNQSDTPPAHNLVKPGSTMDPKAAPAGQGQGGQQQGQQGQQNQVQNKGQIGQGLSEQDQKALQERQQQAWDAAAEREKSNNPATRDQRTYDKNAPGMHPPTSPRPIPRINKGTRLDLEDVTGNPGGRGVNPDAPANSINRAPYNDSINEPRHIDQNWPTGAQRQQAAGQQAGGPVTESINEPYGSQVIPPGAGQGTGNRGPARTPMPSR